ncbi:MAG: CPBP family intramembrane glutamic endopeptidase, BDIM_20840 family [Pseudomonadota bacterium]
MLNEIILATGQVGIIAIIGLAWAFFFRQDFQPGWFIAALFLYVLYDALLTGGFYALPNVLPESQWNWFGKTLSLAGMLIVAALPGFGFARAGITLKQKNGYLSALFVLLLLTALVFYFALTTGDGPDNLETILFQWTMPGLDEEVFYRGVLLLALNEAFRGRQSILGAPIGFGGILTAVLFGLAHALSYNDGGYAFDVMTFVVTGVPSLILLWLRERTGSILFPVIAHNVVNGAFTLF